MSCRELKASLASRHPYGKWLKRTQIVLRGNVLLEPDGSDLPS